MCCSYQKYFLANLKVEIERIARNYEIKEQYKGIVEYICQEGVFKRIHNSLYSNYLSNSREILAFFKDI